MRLGLTLAGGMMALLGGWFVWANEGGQAPNGAAIPGASMSSAPSGVPSPEAGLAPHRPGSLAFVIDSGDASISLFDVATRQEIRRIPLLREPHHMALTPDHRFLLVGDTTANEMLFLDPMTGVVEKRMPVSDPYQFGFSPDGRWLVINGLLRNQVDIYDAGTMHLANRVPVTGMPSHLSFSPDSATVFVSLQSTGSLTAIDVHSGKPIWKSAVGPAPAGVLWHHDKLLVGIMGADYVAVVSPADGHVERRIHTAKGAHVLFVPHDGKVIYVSNRLDGSVIVLDADSLTELRRFKVAGGPDDMDFAPDGKIWVSRRWAQSIAVVDPTDGTYTTLPAGRSPHGIWLNTHDELPSSATLAVKPGT